MSKAILSKGTKKMTTAIVNFAGVDNSVEDVVSRPVGVDARKKIELIEDRSYLDRQPAVKLNGTEQSVVVYDSFNYESVFAAAMVKKHFNTCIDVAYTEKGSNIENAVKGKFDTINAVSAEDIIPSNGLNYLWLDVKKVPPSGKKSHSEHANHLCYDENQPYITEPRDISFFGRIFGHKSITEEEQRLNDIISFVDGPIDTRLEYQQLTYVTLLDKVMLDLCIFDTVEYTKLSMMIRAFRDRTMTPMEETGFYCTLKSALASLKEDKDFEIVTPSAETITEWTSDLVAMRSMLPSKSAVYKFYTASNTLARVAITTLPPAMYFIASRVYEESGTKTLNIISGMNGRFFTGNVRLKEQQFVGEKIEYIN